MSSRSVERDEKGRIVRETAKTHVVREVLRYQLVYSMAGLLLGFSCVLGGIVLFLHGVVGATSWTAKFIGAESKISDAAPGAVLFIVGLFAVWITRFKTNADN